MKLSEEPERNGWNPHNLFSDQAKYGELSIEILFQRTDEFPITSPPDHQIRSSISREPFSVFLELSSHSIRSVLLRAVATAERIL